MEIQEFRNHAISVVIIESVKFFGAIKRTGNLFIKASAIAGGKRWKYKT